MPEYFIGIMSGTSMDGVDAVLADLGSELPKVLGHAAAGFDRKLRDELLALNSPGDNELHRAWLAGNALMRLYAEVTRRALQDCGIAAAAVAAIGAHGQTVRHQPGEHDGTGYTIQLAQPALLAELTGISVVADFRSRDVAAGGQGAPLAPFFHQAVFARPGETVGVLNVGGISNLTVLRPDGELTGFDCGPGNVFMDMWCAQHRGAPFDLDGAWAAQGRVDGVLLEQMLRDPFFALPAPKSTGRDLFNRAWLDRQLAACAPVAPVDVQASLTELTARTCADAVLKADPRPTRLIACGGGALNLHLMSRLGSLLEGVQVSSSANHGIPPLQVEALAFAWLARKTLRHETLDLPTTTGAKGARVLGAIYPA